LTVIMYVRRAIMQASNPEGVIQHGTNPSI
jgi:hypothetical protein